uniref:Ig-like domain-containing protein n=1 Tax=Salmo trutta TaxID=8032 RepID=A0A673VM24_SALTR
MTRPVRPITFHVLAGTESSSIRQESGLMSANVGDTLVLHCFHESDMAVLFSWYKQTLGDKLQLFSTVNKYDRNATFYHEFKDNPRFSVENGQEKNHLRISDMQLSDSGTYYCGSSYSNKMEFGEGAILIVKASGSRNMTVLQQSVSETVQPGDSVTLNCTIHTETCAGEHSVYWFRHGSGESHPGIIYTHGDRNDQCENSPEAGSPTQSCVYNLPKRNLSLSDAGTYYCAVASCGQILFGKGTKLDIEGKLNSKNVSFQSLLKKTDFQIRQSTEIYDLYLVPSYHCYNHHSLHYVALNLSNNKNRSRRQRNTMEEETVYSGIRQ